MIRAVEIDLIAESSAHGVFSQKVETRRTVFAEIRSIGMQETYVAHSAGIEPSIVFVLADYMEYNNEKIVEWDSKRYRVIRTYVSNMSIELTCEEATVDA